MRISRDCPRMNRCSLRLQYVETAGLSKPLVALLPMKEHSARIPNKNFKPFAGKPLFRWVLDTLLSIDEIELIVINTDARSKLRESGVIESERLVIRDRKPELLGDEVSMNRIIEDDIEAIAADLYLMTHSTNPLLRATTIMAGLTAFRGGDHDSLFGVNRVQSRFYTQTGQPLNHDPDNLVPTQDLEPWFEENSCLYLFTRQSFGDAGARIGKNPLLFEIPKSESIDIDILQDWEIAEAIARNGE